MTRQSTALKVSCLETSKHDSLQRSLTEFYKNGGSMVSIHNSHKFANEMFKGALEGFTQNLEVVTVHHPSMTIRIKTSAGGSVKLRYMTYNRDRLRGRRFDRILLWVDLPPEELAFLESRLAPNGEILHHPLKFMEK